MVRINYLEEIRMAIAEGGFSLEQVDTVLYLETRAIEGKLTAKEKKQIVNRNF